MKFPGFMEHIMASQAKLSFKWPQLLENRPTGGLLLLSGESMLQQPIKNRAGRLIPISSLLTGANRPNVWLRISTPAAALALAVFGSGYAVAASPAGEWWVHDKDARIQIVDCGGAMWGVISWEKMPGTDSHNPDPAKRNRAMLGVPIILGMKAKSENEWSGTIYNSAFGQTVPGTIALHPDNTLRITGCVLGFLCGGENWTRFEPAVASGPAKPNEAVCKSVSAGG